jgi:hypothetical protein
VRIRFYDTSPFFDNGAFAEPRLLAEDVLQFAHDPSRDTCGFTFTECPAGYRYQPAYIQLSDLVARYPALSQAIQADGSTNLGIRIAITPLTPGLRYWPMVSVTENATSVVSIYTAR